MKTWYCILSLMASIFIHNTMAKSEVTEVQSCLEFTTPSDSGKLCPLKIYTFTCNVDSTYLVWHIDDNKYALYQNESGRLMTGHTAVYEYIYKLHSSERLDDGNYAMKSSLIIYPLIASFRFTVSCSTRCGEDQLNSRLIRSRSRIYEPADIPNKPKDLQLVAKIKNHCDGSRAQFNWTHPENSARTLLCHYDVVLKDRGIVEPRYNTMSPVYLHLKSSTNYTFKVQAVDECGQRGTPAEISITTPDPATKGEVCRNDQD